MNKKDKILQDIHVLIFSIGFFLILGTVGASDVQLMTNEFPISSARILSQMVLGLSLMWISTLALNSSKIIHSKCDNMKKNKK